jgi:hypothetical protein
MKKIFNYLVLGLIVTGFASCEKYLDVNTNPNSATEGPADLVLPQAIVATAALSSNYSSGMADVAGLQANIYGVGGYGTVVTYAYTTSNFTTFWTNAYDNAQDYQYVIDNTSADASQIFSTSMARIMKAFVFSKLVDQYNAVPYFDALKGQAVLLPKYDDPVLIYKDLVAQLNKAIADITAAQAKNTAVAGSVPFPYFKADPLMKPTSAVKIGGVTQPALSADAAMTRWKKFANSLKLRLLIKLAFSGKDAAFSTAQFATWDTALGILADDATVNPLYSATTGQQNPTYAAYGFTVAGARVNAQRIPTRWILSFYNGTKIIDPSRQNVIFKEPTTARSNQLGNETTVTTQVPSTSPVNSSSWFTGSTPGGNAQGFVKGNSQDQVIMLLSEANFLLAEAYERGYLAGGTAPAQVQFYTGIRNSFRYLYKTAGSSIAGDDIPADAAIDPTFYAYANPGAATALTPSAALAAVVGINAGNAKVQYGGSLDAKIEQIITQKYIALAYITSDEIFNEFRRTGYPAITNGSASETATFASTQSNSTRADKLPSRIPYPSTEYATNAGNIPVVGIFTDRIFWDLN